MLNSRDVAKQRKKTKPKHTSGLYSGNAFDNRELKQTTTTTATRPSPNKSLMSKTIAVHVRYKSLYISLPSSAKQQREMTKFCVVYGTWTTTANFSHFHLELNAVVAYLA